MKRLILVLGAIAAVIALFYAFNAYIYHEKQGDGSAVPPIGEPFWQTVDAGSFSVSLPPGWEYRPMQGIDSQVGEFAGDGVVLGFDYGWYSNPLPSGVGHTVTYETIDGRNAKLVVPTAVTNGTTGVYFEDVGDGMTRLQISGMGLNDDQQETVLNMFRTVRFNK